MPPNLRPLLLVGVLAWAALAHTQTAARPSIPTRSLLPEMDRAAEGTHAFIHTDFGTGSGFLLRAEQEVLVARHTVLTPEGEIANTIGVGILQPPLNNVMELHAMAIAQDPVHDLVLLRIDDAARENAALPAGAPPAKASDPEEQAADVSAQSKHEVRRETVAGERRRRAARRGDGARPHRRSRAQKKLSPGAKHVPVHVVVDGP